MAGRLTTCVMVVSCLAGLQAAKAQSDAEAGAPSLQAASQTIEAPIESVTLYQGRAAVTRTASLALPQGLHELRIERVAESIQPGTLQARAGGQAKVLNVEFSEEPSPQSGDPEIKALDERIQALRNSIKELDDQRVLLKSEDAFLDGIVAKITGGAGDKTGSADLDLDALRRHMAFVREERHRISSAQRERELRQADLEAEMKAAQAQRDAAAAGRGVNRVAIITVAVPQEGPCSIELTYLVSHATWTPSYNVRADLGGAAASVEYDAMIAQRTGESWNDVKLTLSTAQPTQAANPPALEPWFVDIDDPEARAAREAARLHAAETIAGARARPAAPPPGPAADPRQALEDMAADAQVAGQGPSVTFELPRRVTVATNAAKQQRTRIATIDAQPKFMHVAVPSRTEAVYLRGDMVNQSPFQLLAGPAAIFAGQDYVGPTSMPAVPPGGQFQMHFGIDQSVKAQRQLVSKTTESTGLLGGGRRTDYSHRLTLDNASAEPVFVELWDRHPVSRNEEIQIEVRDLSDPLAADAQYVNEQRPQGLLKWVLEVPAGATGANARVATFGVRIDRAKDVQMTDLPE